MASSKAPPSAEEVVDWAMNEMHFDLYGKNGGLDADTVRRLCRGNMAPIWKFLLERVRSEKTVRDVRRNLIVHGKGDQRVLQDTAFLGTAQQSSSEREEALLEKAAAQAEVARLQDQVADLERSLQQQMEDVAREERQREKDASEHSDQDFRTAVLETYSSQLSEAISLFREYKKRLESHTQHARSAKQNATQAAPKQVFERPLDTRSEQTKSSSKLRLRHLETPMSQSQHPAFSKSSSWTPTSNLSSKYALEAKATEELVGNHSKEHSDRSVVKATVTGRPFSDKALLETAAERDVREACEALASLLETRIAESVPEFQLSDDSLQEASKTDSVTFNESSPQTYEESPWSGSNLSAQKPESSNGGIAYLGSSLPLGGPISDVLGALPHDLVDKLLQLLESPNELLQSLASCTGRAAEMLKEETGCIDIRGDADKLRFKYENNKIVEDSSTYSEKGGARSALALLRERQKAHVDQFMRTEEAYSQAEESKRETEGVLRALLEASAKNETQETILELQVWAQERELAGVKAAIAVLEAEVARLTSAKEERKRAEVLLRKKWQQIVEFDGRRFALEALHNDLRRENDELAAAWPSITEKSRAFSSEKIVPFREKLHQIAQSGKDGIAREMEAFIAVPHRLLPPQIAEARTEVEESALRSLLSEAVSGNLAAVSTVQRARAARHSQSVAATSASSPMRLRGLVGTSAHSLDKGLPKILQGLTFCQPEYASIAGLIPAVAKQLQEVKTLQALVADGRLAVDEVSNARPELLNQVDDVSATSASQDEEMESEVLPRTRGAVEEAKFAIEDSERVRRLITEWWEQPASTSVPWVTLDGENVATWLSRVRQLQSALRTKAELNQLERALDQRQ